MQYQRYQHGGYITIEPKSDNLYHKITLERRVPPYPVAQAKITHATHIPQAVLAVEL